MKVIIPYRLDDHNGLELKYCIRSVVKHFVDFTGVCLIGDRPDWYVGEHIPAKDINGRKELSIVNKILQSPYNDFLLCSDDIYALQPFDSTLPMYYSCKLKDYKGFGHYPERVNNVMQIYPEGLMYDAHKPMVINLSKYKEANKVDWSKEYLQKSLYGNFIGGGVQLDDYKIKRLQHVDMSQPFFSTGGYVANLINFDMIFPDKSEYEK